MQAVPPRAEPASRREVTPGHQVLCHLA